MIEKEKAAASGPDPIKVRGGSERGGHLMTERGRRTASLE